MTNPNQITLAKAIKWNPKKGITLNASAMGFDVASLGEAGADLAATRHMNEWLHAWAMGKDGGSIREQHELMGANMVEPIQQVIPYLRWTQDFFMPQGYDDLQDNSIPVEDYVTTGYQSHPDAGSEFVRPGIGWTQPTFHQYESGVAMPWSHVAKAGWNVFGRMMQRSAEEIARLIDTAAQYVIDTAVTGTAGLSSVVAGGVMTKASMDYVIKQGATIGFPMLKGAINTGTLTDMTGWSGGPFYAASLPDEVSMQIIQTLHLPMYGGVFWDASPFVPADYIYFHGPSASVGYEQTRGSGRAVSDVSIVNKEDQHLIISPEIAQYVGNSLSLRRLHIIA